MLEFKLINTPNNTKMVAILLDKKTEIETIDKEAIAKAITLLYGEGAEIKSIKINDLTPHLDTSACLDYFIEIQKDNKTYLCCNFGCCFLDLNDIKELYKHSGSEDICLKLLRGDRYYIHPLYYKDYAKAIRQKVEEIIKQRS